MNLEITGLRLPLSAFALEVDARLEARITGVFGASGAGKTSLLEVIAGLRRPAAGRVALDGRVLLDAGRRFALAPERRRIGYVPQDDALFPHLNVRQNLCYSHAAGRPGHPPAITYARVVEVLNLGDLAERRVSSLSGGERQRVAFGRAVLASPRLLLLDEPLDGLDAELQQRVIPYLLTIRDEFGIPMLYVSHNADEIVALCDDVVLLDRGRCTHRGPPAALFTASPAPHYMLKPG
ncbi:MAG TPA: ATP-binding cassette domain-containing protein [Opitutaceae bacterium]|nr:ATP-binding cassette domain-containing protein [Opitutaceae bacterium]